MLSEERIRLMTKMAIYEKQQGEKDFVISGYAKQDYISLHVITTLLWTTLGYVVLAGLFVLAKMDYLAHHLTLGMSVGLLIGAIVLYIVLLIFLGKIASRVYREKHRKARQRVKYFYGQLSRLNKLYEKEKK